MGCFGAILLLLIFIFWDLILGLLAAIVGIPYLIFMSFWDIFGWWTIIAPVAIFIIGLLFSGGGGSGGWRDPRLDD